MAPCGRRAGATTPPVTTCAPRALPASINTRWTSSDDCCKHARRQSPANNCSIYPPSVSHTRQSRIPCIRAAQLTVHWKRINRAFSFCIAVYNVCESQIPLRYLVRTSSEPASVMEFGFKALKLARVNEESHGFTCHPDAYPQVE